MRRLEGGTLKMVQRQDRNSDLLDTGDLDNALSQIGGAVKDMSARAKVIDRFCRVPTVNTMASVLADPALTVYKSEWIPIALSTQAPTSPPESGSATEVEYAGGEPKFSIGEDRPNTVVFIRSRRTGFLGLGRSLEFGVAKTSDLTGDSSINEEIYDVVESLDTKNIRNLEYLTGMDPEIWKRSLLNGLNSAMTHLPLFRSDANRKDLARVERILKRFDYPPEQAPGENTGR
ncbi:MAG: hypothetical protein V1744_00720 [Candidatus Altiarchaeota archaeon]